MPGRPKRSALLYAVDLGARRRCASAAISIASCSRARRRSDGRHEQHAKYQRCKGGTIMSHAFRATVMIAAAAGALSGMAGERLYAQGADPNAAPNPYKMQAATRGSEIRSGHQGPGRSQRWQEHLGVRPLRGDRMHEFDARADGEV